MEDDLHHFEDAVDEQICEPKEGQIYTDEFGYTYKKPKKWDLLNSFEFESDDLATVIRDANPGNAGITEDILAYQQPEKIMNFGGAPVRLILYDRFSEEEKAKIASFKDFCKEKNEHILDVDEEIMRFLYAKNFNN